MEAAYARGFTMQATLAVVGFLLGVGAWWTTREVMWLAGAVAHDLCWERATPVAADADQPVDPQLLQRLGDLAGAVAAAGQDAYSRLVMPCSRA